MDYDGFLMHFSIDSNGNINFRRVNIINFNRYNEEVYECYYEGKINDTFAYPYTTKITITKVINLKKNEKGIEEEIDITDKVVELKDGTISFYSSTYGKTTHNTLSFKDNKINNWISTTNYFKNDNYY